MATQTWVETMPQTVAAHVEHDWWADLRALPTLPSVLFRFLGLVGNPQAEAQELGEFIWNDPALLSRALPLAAAKAGDGESLQEAVACLSREKIRRIAFTTPLLRSFETLGAGSFALTCWERSLVCGAACQAAARYLDLAHTEHYYVAGMLHDMGYLALLQKRPTLLPAILAQWAECPTRLLEIEEELIGLDHCRLGLEIARRLGLEPWLFPAIGAHHSPTPDSDIMTRITAIGGAFASSLGVDLFPRRSLSRDTRDREIQEIVLGLLPGFSDEDSNQLFRAMERAIQPARQGVRETVVEWQTAGESRLRPYPARPALRLAPLPAIA